MTIDPFCGWEKNRFTFPMNDVQIIYANLTFLRGLLDSQLALSDNLKKKKNDKRLLNCSVNGEAGLLIQGIYRYRTLFAG